MRDATILPPRSALYMPASNARAIEKARGLPADMIILDLEDAVKPGLKDEARQAAVDAMAEGFGDRLTAIRINGIDTSWHRADLAAARQARCDFVVLPKVVAVDPLHLAIPKSMNKTEALQRLNRAYIKLKERGELADLLPR